MWKVAKFFILALVAIVLLAFALANRQSVSVSFDPFASGGTPAFAIPAPMFVVLLLTLIVGVIVGGAAVWFNQGRFRRAARQSRAEADRLRAQTASAPAVR
jgi:uncharacterized integral membrane protein